jgi:hypothetical protein
VSVKDRETTCERATCATATTLTLGGAPSPFLEFLDTRPLGTLCDCQLLHMTRSLRPSIVEIGRARLVAANTLVRVKIFRSAEANKPIIFARGASTGQFFVRAVPR